MTHRASQAPSTSAPLFIMLTRRSSATVCVFDSRSATKWETLGDFVQYLGKTGLCRVDHNEKGWWVTYIDRDPRVLARQEELAKRAEQSRDEEERAAERLEKQLEEARAAEEAIKAARAEAGAGEAGDGADAQPELSRELGPRGEDDKIEFNISAAPHAASSHATSAAAAASPAVAASSGAPAASSVAPAAAAIAPKPSSMSLAKPSVFKAFSSDSSSSAADSGAAVGSKRKAVPGASTLDALMAENERQKEQEQAMKKLRAEAPAAAQPSTAAASTSSGKWLDYWLTPNIVVKILNKKLLGGALYKQKGVVVRVIDRYVGEIRLLGPGADGAPPGSLLRIDQAELETVLPALGKLVRVVNGVYRGEIAVLLELDEARYAATLRIESGLLRGKEVSGVDYEDICKLHEGP